MSNIVKLNDNPKSPIPLWQLCKQSLSPQENRSQINQFLKHVRPSRFLHIQKHVLLQRVFNLLFAVKMIMLDYVLFGESSKDNNEWRFGQIMFLIVLFIELLFFSQKRQKGKDKSFIQPLFSSSSTSGINVSNNKPQQHGITFKLIDFILKLFPTMTQYLILAISYFLYITFMSYFNYSYYQSSTSCILLYLVFVYLLVSGNGGEDDNNNVSSLQNNNAMNKSVILIFLMKMNSFSMGFLSLILINRYQFCFQYQEPSFQHEESFSTQSRFSTVQTLLIIDILALFFLMQWFTIKWSFFVIGILFLIHIICMIDKQCLCLKKKYKDQGQVVNYQQYH